MVNEDSIKPRRHILYCRMCKWSGEPGSGFGASGRCPECKDRGVYTGLSFVWFHEHEKAQADAVLQQDIGKSVDDVKPYEVA